MVSIDHGGTEAEADPPYSALRDSREDLEILLRRLGPVPGIGRMQMRLRLRGTLFLWISGQLQSVRDLVSLPPDLRRDHEAFHAEHSGLVLWMANPRPFSQNVYTGLA